MLSDVNETDKILAYDKETGKNKFSPLIGWMHRDTESYL